MSNYVYALCGLIVTEISLSRAHTLNRAYVRLPNEFLAAGQASNFDRPSGVVFVCVPVCARCPRTRSVIHESNQKLA